MNVDLKEEIGAWRFAIARALWFVLLTYRRNVIRLAAGSFIASNRCQVAFNGRLQASLRHSEREQ